MHNKIQAGAIITDCCDPNARARQELRFASLFGIRPTFLGVGREAPDIEAAGNVLDQLEALANGPASRKDSQSVLLVNVAPRGEAVKQAWDNGTPFCYFWVGKTLVVSTYEGRSLSLARSRGLVQEVNLLDIPTVTAAAVQWGELTNAQAEAICHTQFRSLEFLPLVAYWLVNGRDVLARTRALPNHDTTGIVWCVDNFGNAKTTLLATDINFEQGKRVTLADGKTVTCYRRLADVPKDASALVIGSSGYGSDKFLEVVVQWQDGGVAGSGNAAKRHSLRVGSPVLAPNQFPLNKPDSFYNLTEKVQ